MQELHGESTTSIHVPTIVILYSLKPSMSEYDIQFARELIALQAICCPSFVFSWISFCGGISSGKTSPSFSTGKENRHVYSYKNPQNFIYLETETCVFQNSLKSKDFCRNWWDKAWFIPEVFLVFPSLHSSR